MKKIITVFFLLPLFYSAVDAQTTDSVDVLDYDLTLDLKSGRPFKGDATLTLQLLRPCAEIGFDLLGTLDSAWMADVRIENADILHLSTEGIAIGDTFTIRLCYRGLGYVEANGWGGFHFDNTMHYNLGVGFGTDPHVLGRAVFPCRDNFTDKATYTLRITSKKTWSAECSGVLQSRVVDTADYEHSVWRIDQPVCTYLVGISQAAFSRIEDTVAGYPVTIGYTYIQNPTVVTNVFALLDSVVPMFERCFGPYRWHRIGYIPTDRGSMEHVNNIALAYQAMTSVSESGQSTIAHELGHAWFGNLLTCADEGDMWINEGGASFTSEVARESTHGRASSDRQYQKNLEKVIRTAHIDDGAYRPLHGMPHAQTYGTTTYEKGALVWHSLRGYLGDSLFYASLRTLFDRCAFSNIDAYALRDSLSAYSGVDLTDFFTFHVFNAGFVDYHLELLRHDNSAELRVVPQGVGTSAVPQSHRFSVAFYSNSGEKYTMLITGDGAGQFRKSLAALPFTPAFCVLDPDCELSDAATVDTFIVQPSGQVGSDICHLRLTSNGNANEATYYVEHHWGHPYGVDTVPGVIRTANRYWVVNGLQLDNPDVEAKFHYVRTGYNNSGYANLDYGFLDNQSMFDSLGLLWRPDALSSWQLVSRQFTNRNDGYMQCQNLRVGEYTIAVIDTALLAVENLANPSQVKATLFPNPVHAGDTFTLELPEGDFMLSASDLSGRCVIEPRACRSGDSVKVDLPAGTYLVNIENNFISLQSKLIVL